MLSQRIRRPAQPAKQCYQHKNDAENLQWSKRRSAERPDLAKAIIAICSLAVCVLIITITGRQQFGLPGHYDLNIIPACSYNQLETSFSSLSLSANDEHANNENCWSLQEEVLRIPPSAIVNRNHLPKLGNGFKGGVHLAIFDLGGDKKSWCKAALKTDHCHSLLHDNNLFTDQTSLSCVSDNSFLWNDASYLGGEYTGALVFRALQKRQRKMQAANGIIPTWAVVYDDSSKGLVSIRPRSWLQGAPHPDNKLLGMVMPLVDFTPSNQLDRQRRRLLSGNLTSLANMLLPAAEALEFVNGLGLAFQDLLPSNVGITDENHSVLYDNSYMALQKDVQCPWQQDHDVCAFCREPVFFKANYTQHRWEGHTAIQSDLRSFRKVIKGFSSGFRYSNTFNSRLDRCEDIHHVVSLLRQVSRHAYDPNRTRFLQDFSSRA
jgi:hypothetical protein